MLILIPEKFEEIHPILLYIKVSYVFQRVIRNKRHRKYYEKSNFFLKVTPFPNFSATL